MVARQKRAGPRVLLPVAVAHVEAQAGFCGFAVGHSQAAEGRRFRGKDEPAAQASPPLPRRAQR
eukprot:3467958-Lingulodinium_polyedra.AAC.1